MDRRGLWLGIVLVVAWLQAEPQEWRGGLPPLDKAAYTPYTVTAVGLGTAAAANIAALCATKKRRARLAKLLFGRVNNKTFAQRLFKDRETTIVFLRLVASGVGGLVAIAAAQARLWLQCSEKDRVAEFRSHVLNWLTQSVQNQEKNMFLTGGMDGGGQSRESREAALVRRAQDMKRVSALLAADTTRAIPALEIIDRLYEPIDKSVAESAAATALQVLGTKTWGSDGRDFYSVFEHVKAWPSVLRGYQRTLAQGIEAGLPRLTPDQRVQVLRDYCLSVAQRPTQAGVARAVRGSATLLNEEGKAQLLAEYKKHALADIRVAECIPELFGTYLQPPLFYYIDNATDPDQRTENVDFPSIACQYHLGGMMLDAALAHPACVPAFLSAVGGWLRAIARDTMALEQEKKRLADEVQEAEQHVRAATDAITHKTAELQNPAAALKPWWLEDLAYEIGRLREICAQWNTRQEELHAQLGRYDAEHAQERQKLANLQAANENLAMALNAMKGDYSSVPFIRLSRAVGAEQELHGVSYQGLDPLRLMLLLGHPECPRGDLDNLTAALLQRWKTALGATEGLERYIAYARPHVVSWVQRHGLFPGNGEGDYPRDPRRRIIHTCLYVQEASEAEALAQYGASQHIIEMVACTNSEELRLLGRDTLISLMRREGIAAKDAALGPLIRCCRRAGTEGEQLVIARVLVDEFKRIKKCFLGMQQSGQIGDAQALRSLQPAFEELYTFLHGSASASLRALAADMAIFDAETHAIAWLSVGREFQAEHPLRGNQDLLRRITEYL